jgi:hypothetical protein
MPGALLKGKINQAYLEGFYLDELQRIGGLRSKLGCQPVPQCFRDESAGHHDNKVDMFANRYP